MTNSNAIKTMEQQIADLNEQLEKANVELKIEASLERVRARTMAMRHSDELTEVVKLLYQEFDKLKINNESTDIEIGLIDEETGIAKVWAHFYLSDGTISTFKLPLTYIEEINNEFNIWKATPVEKRNEIFLTTVFSGDLSEKFKRITEDFPELAEIFRPLIEAKITKWVTHNAYFSHGLLTLQGTEAYSSEIQEIQKRFTKVFEQTYTRFLDLQKAEAQAREAQIEVAVERVRAKALAMHKSEEILAVVAALRNELLGLNIPGVSGTTIYLEQEDGRVRMWDLTSVIELKDGFHLTMDIVFQLEKTHPDLYIRKLWNAAEKYSVQIQNRNDLMVTVEWLGEFKKEEAENVKQFIETSDLQNLFHSTVPLTHGKLSVDLMESPPTEMESILQKMATAFDLAYKRFLDLQKAEAQAREAQIEAGLERVRSRSLAMHKPSELQEVIHTVHKELLNLNIAIHGGSFISINSDVETELRCWGAGGTANTSDEVHLPRYEKPFCTNLINGIKNGPGFFTEEYTQQEKKEFFTFLFNYEPWSKLDAKQKNETLSSPGGYTRSCCVSRHTTIFIINHYGEKFSAADNDILKRFGKVFEQTYTRFLDLQKAEAQTREAQIETGLERVRSKTMAMHKSEEVTGVAVSLNEELMKLGFQGGSTIIIMDKETGDTEQWTGFSEDKTLKSCYVPYFKHPFHDAQLDAWKKGEKFLVQAIAGEEKKTLDEHYFSTGYKDFPENDKKWMRAMESVTFSYAFMKYGAIHWGPDHLTAEQLRILQRFSKVFEQSYTRFLDLKKAEAQAKEAQIEAALEKVRSRSLAMHKSEEMRDMVKVVFERLKELNFAIDGGVFIGIPDTSTNSFNLWVGDDHSEYPTCFNLPHSDAAPIADVWKASQDGSDFVSKIYSKEEKNKWFQFAFKHTDFKILPDQLKDWILQQEFLTQTFALAKHSGIGIHFHHSRELAVGEIDILKRFTKVFEQGYIRFLDLQKAEAQAREAKIESALERVRSRSMGMQKSEELKEVIQVVYEQFVHLNIHTEHTGFVMDYMTTNDRNIWVASKHAVPSYLTIPYFDSEYYNSFNEAKEKGMNFFATNLTFEEKNSFYQQLFKYIPNLPDEAKEFYFSCPALAVSTVLLDNVALYIENFEGIAFSDEDNTILMRFGKVFQQTYTRFLDLQKAEAQAREAKIEAALEKVRSRSLAMHKSDELQEVVHTVIGRLTELNIEVFTTIIITFAEDSKDIVWWLENKMSDQFPHILLKYEDNSYLKDVFEARKNGKELFSKCYVGQEKKELYQYLFDHTDLRHTPESQKEFLFGNEFAAISIAFAKNTAIHITSYSKRSFSEEETDILKRFAKVFDQAYTRFLDLQKAEAQAREAEIELALERVRARTMAMQSPTEFAEVINVIGGQFTHLGFDIEWANFGANGLDIAEGIDTWNFAVVPGADPVSSRLFIPRFDHPLFMEAAEQLANYQKTGKDLFVMTYGKEDKDLWLDHLFTKTIFKDVPEEYRAIQYAKPGYTTSNLALKDTFLSIGKFDPISFTEEQHAILRRFGNAFGLAYTRFLDLQKAEAQAREAQIEAALERVRSRTMGMQKSEELPQAANLLFQQIESLGIPVFSTGYNIWNENKTAVTSWMSSQGIIQSPFNLPLTEEPALVECYTAAQRGDTFFVQEIGGEKLSSHFGYMSSLPVIGELMKKMSSAGISMPDHMFNHHAFFSQGYLLFISYQQVPEAHEIFKRFAKVFEQTYTRFLDLEKAEAQVREAEIELALERVRARTMAMHKSDELKEVIQVVYEQFVHLNIHVEHAGFITDYKERDDMNIWLADKHEVPFQVTIPYFDSPHWNSFNEAKQKGTDFFANHLSFEQKNKFYQDLFKIIPVPDETKEYYFNCPGLAISTVLLENVGLYIENFSGISYTDEENKILIRFGKVFQQTYTRFLDLQKAEAQAREAQIETALERIRARAMAMHTSEELIEVANILREQMGLLGQPEIETSVVNLYDAESDLIYNWNAFRQPGASGSIVTSTSSFSGSSSELTREMISHYRSGEKEFTLTATGPKLMEFFEVLIKSDPLVANYAGRYVPDQVFYHFTSFTGGTLLTVSYQPPFDETKMLQRRASSVFDMAYRRYLDLKKAEAQAREAKIEAALERVRSRTMGMQHSNELQETAQLLFQQFQGLGTAQWACGFVIWDDDRHAATAWMSSVAGLHPSFKVDSSKDVFVPIYEAAQRGESLFVYEQSGKELETHYEHMGTIRIFREVIMEDWKKAGIPLPTFQIIHCAFFAQGYLMFISFEPVPEAHDIFRRFAKVFEQTYTRFLDLQKAEAQAREALIEAALERVRASTMAMQKSDDLSQTAFVLFNQFKELGEAPERIFIATFDDHDSGVIDLWGTDQGGNKLNKLFKVPVNEPTMVSKIIAGWKEKKKSVIVDLQGEELKTYLGFLKLAGIPVTEGVMTERRVQTAACFSNGVIGVTTPEPQSAEAVQLQERFAGVFDLTYTRFLDLQKAEARAHEAKIETALERVRARALAMQEPEELKDVAQVLRNEMGALGVEELETCSIYIHEKDSETAECWYALKDPKVTEKRMVSDHFHLELNDTWVGREMKKFYSSDEKQTSVVMQGANRKEWIDYCYKHSPVFSGFYGETIPDRTYHLYKFSHGYIGAASPGEISAESWKLLSRAASVFSLAYSRFKDLTQARNDLIQLKEEKKRAEDALTELQATQKQLIQSEKMASLGELTAGIAHEIQNPLNFVNNFSDVSNELIEELKIKNEKLKIEDEEVKGLLNDISQNLEKINHHGKRADAIVKGMLQHSRTSSGQKELTDINTLAEEYIRLAYHGLRAKDKFFSAKFETELDPSLNKINIVPQEIGRVILNLINNSFYAVSEKKKNTSNGYEPIVTVSTKAVKPPPGGGGLGVVEISVRDNGNGIPIKVLDKIFQPFFTTKPTGQGTGLGLSLSYDIVTKGHNGEIKVETKEGEGSVFTITLPMN